MRSNVERLIYDYGIHEIQPTTITGEWTIGPMGGGPGMVMLAEPLTKTLQRLRDDGAQGRVIHLTPQGSRLK